MSNSLPESYPLDAPRSVSGAAIIKSTTALNGLPPVSEAGFDGRPPWTVVSTRTLVTSLGIGDRGLFATWRCRGIGPDELPSTWFRPASGRPNYYLITDVLAWLAARRGEPFDTTAAWWECLRTNFGDERTNVAPDEVRRQAALYARVAGPATGDVRFTPAGFSAYLASLLEA